MKKIISSLIAFSAPVFVFAQGADAVSILTVLRLFVDKLIPFLITAALLFFIFGVVRYMIAGNPDDKDKAKKIVINGIVGLFVILSVWGIVGVIQRTFGVGNAQITVDNIPTVNVQ